jgi:hypothetical protein
MTHSSLVGDWPGGGRAVGDVRHRRGTDHRSRSAVFLKLKEFEALGTSLAALIPPVGLLGAIEYYRNGYVNIKYAALIAFGLFLGAYFGARLTLGFSPEFVRKLVRGLPAGGGRPDPVLWEVKAADQAVLAAFSFAFNSLAFCRTSSLESDRVLKIEHWVARFFRSLPSSTTISCSTQLERGMLRK